MAMYNLIEYSNNYSKTSRSSWQYCRGKPAVNDNGVIGDFNATNFTHSFNSKEEITSQTNDNDTKIVEILVPLKYLSNVWTTLKCC